MANESNGSAGGLGFSGALFIVFLVLKLTHQIGWSWFWVTAPLWGGLALALTIVGGALVLALIAASVKRR